MESHIIKTTSTFLFKLTSSKAFNNARQVLNKPTSQTFINGLKFNNTDNSKFTEKLRTGRSRQVWLVHGLWSHCQKASAFEFHIAIYLTINIAILTSNSSKLCSSHLKKKTNVFIYYIKHKRPCLITFLKTENKVENTTGRGVV